MRLTKTVLLVAAFSWSQHALAVCEDFAITDAHKGYLNSKFREITGYLTSDSVLYNRQIGMLKQDIESARASPDPSNVPANECLLREVLAYQDKNSPRANASKSNKSPTDTTKRSASTASSGRTYRTADHCVRYDDSSNNLADFFENRCNFPVWVTFLNQNGAGAAGPIKPGKKETVSKGKGKIEWAACEYPASARAGTTMRDPVWRGGRYACVSPN